MHTCTYICTFFILRSILIGVDVFPVDPIDDPEDEDGGCCSFGTEQYSST